MVERQLERQLRQAAERLSGVPEDAARAQLGRWQEEWRPAAEREVRALLLLDAIAAARASSRAEEAQQAEIERLAASQGVAAARLREALGEAAVRAHGARPICARKWRLISLPLRLRSKKISDT